MHEATAIFTAERPRLIRLATRILGDPDQAQDIAQQAWLRLQRAEGVVDVPAWLTTVTSRLCLDRLRERTPVPMAEVELPDHAPDPAEDVVLADTLGIALHVVLDRLAPRERVAFVLHDIFAFDFATIGAVVDATPAAARQLASRARSKVRQHGPGNQLADWRVVDAFIAAAKGGDLERLLQLLAPDAVVIADDAAILAGTPERIEGRGEVASFFNGSARAALPAVIEGRPAVAWFQRGEVKVVFDFRIRNGVIAEIAFVADPARLATVSRRNGGSAID